MVRHRSIRSTTRSLAEPISSSRPTHVSSSNGSSVSRTKLTRSRRASGLPPKRSAHQASVAVPTSEIWPASWCATPASAATCTAVPKDRVSSWSRAWSPTVHEPPAPVTRTRPSSSVVAR